MTILLGARSATLLTPTPGVFIGISGAKEAFVVAEENVTAELVLILGNGTRDADPTIWLDPTFDFTGFTGATDLILVVDGDSYNVVDLGDGFVQVAGPITQAAGAYTVEGNVIADVAGSTLERAGFDFSRAITATISAGPNSGDYTAVEGAVGALDVAGCELTITWGTLGLTTALAAAGECFEVIYDELQANAIVDSGDTVQAFPDGFGVWADPEPTLVITKTGARASSVDVVITATGLYLQDQFGRAVPTVYQSSEITASIQPLGPRSREIIEAQYGLSVDFKGYTTAPIPITDHRSGHPGALMLIAGETYRVIGVTNWTDLLPHNKFMLSREVEPRSFGVPTAP